MTDVTDSLSPLPSKKKTSATKKHTRPPHHLLHGRHVSTGRRCEGSRGAADPEAARALIALWPWLMYTRTPLSRDSICHTSVANTTSRTRPPSPESSRKVRSFRCLLKCCSVGGSPPGCPISPQWRHQGRVARPSATSSNLQLSRVAGGHIDRNEETEDRHKRSGCPEVGSAVCDDRNRALCSSSANLSSNFLVAFCFLQRCSPRQFVPGNHVTRFHQTLCTSPDGVK